MESFWRLSSESSDSHFQKRAVRSLPTVTRPRVLARLTHSRHSDEAGFSLIELTVVILIMPLIVGAITFALLGVFNLQTGVTNRITDSAAAQVVASNFVKDVQSANIITTQSLPQCGAGTQLLGLKWAKGQNSIYLVLGRTGWFRRCDHLLTRA